MLEVKSEWDINEWSYKRNTGLWGMLALPYPLRDSKFSQRNSVKASSLININEESGWDGRNDNILEEVMVTKNFRNSS